MEDKIIDHLWDEMLEMMRKRDAARKCGTKANHELADKLTYSIHRQQQVIEKLVCQT